jgi:hypothetical protein
MSDISSTFNQAPEVSQPKSNLPEPKLNEVGAKEDVSALEPVEDGQQAILEAMGIDDEVRNMPKADQDNLGEVKQYIYNILDGKGLSPTVGSIKKALTILKEEMGFDEEAEPSVILDRIGGIVKAWRNLSFIKDPKERKSLFMKMAKMESAREMDQFVYEKMEEVKIWR